MVDLKFFNERLEEARKSRAASVAQIRAENEAKEEVYKAACAAQLKGLMKERLGLDVEPTGAALVVPEHEIEFYADGPDEGKEI